MTTTALNGGNIVQLRSGSNIERVTLNERSANTAGNVGIYTGSDASIAELDLSMDSSEENGILAYDGPISIRDSRLSGAGVAYGGFVASQDSADVASQLTRVTIAGFVYGLTPTAARPWRTTAWSICRRSTAPLACVCSTRTPATA